MVLDNRQLEKLNNPTRRAARGLRYSLINVKCTVSGSRLVSDFARLMRTEVVQDSV